MPQLEGKNSEIRVPIKFTPRQIESYKEFIEFVVNGI